MSSITDNLAVLGAPTEQQFHDGLRLGQPILAGSTFRIPHGGTYSTQFEGWRFRTDEWLSLAWGSGIACFDHRHHDFSSGSIGVPYPSPREVGGDIDSGLQLLTIS